MAEVGYTIMTAKGQVTVPKKVRERMGWGEGTKLKIFLDGEEAKIKPVTFADEFEDLVLKDLTDEGYIGENLQRKLLARKQAMEASFRKIIKERLEEAEAGNIVTLEELKLELDVKPSPGNGK